MLEAYKIPYDNTQIKYLEFADASILRRKFFH
jgi:hypothetical protein